MENWEQFQKVKEEACLNGMLEHEKEQLQVLRDLGFHALSDNEKVCLLVEISQYCSKYIPVIDQGNKFFANYQKSDVLEGMDQIKDEDVEALQRLVVYLHERRLERYKKGEFKFSYE